MEALTDGVKPITELVLHYKELAIEEESVSVDVAGRGAELLRVWETLISEASSTHCCSSWVILVGER